MCSDILELNLGRTFDFILIADVLEHIPIVFHQKLFAVLKEHSFPGTLVFVYLPNPLYTDYVRAKNPQKLQIVDESVYLGDFLKKVYEGGFELIYLSLYSIECPEQYVQIILRRMLSLDQRDKMWSRSVK